MFNLRKLLISFIITAVFVSSTVCPVFAQGPSAPAPGAGTTLSQEDPGSQEIIGEGGSEAARWQSDPEVTFTGKLAVRSEDVLDWLIENYQWSNIGSTATPFDKLWEFVRNTVFAILGLFILVGAFLMIITRGRSLTVKRLIVRFVMVLILVIFSFSIVRTVYALTDIVQGFFIIMPRAQGDPTPISTEDLLNVAFPYADFKGFRKIGPEYNESAITSLLLIKITAATYYTMFIILIIRKVILWFFILVSPIFPLLLFFKPIRNTAKIWVGEFFRWVLYAPLFAVFLRGLVEIWKFGVDPVNAPNATGVPLDFSTTTAGTVASVVYPTAINILLGGPGQIVIGANNVNFRDTFVLYLVALLMLWMVIILPWILLRIFLDYFNGSNIGESNLVKFLARNGMPPPGRYRGGGSYPQSGVPTPPDSPPPGSAGMAKSIPLTRFKHTPVAEMQESIRQETIRQQETAFQQGIASRSALSSASSSAYSSGRIGTLNTNVANIQTGALYASNLLNISDAQSQQIVEALGVAGLTIPTLRDIARYETASMQKSGPAKEEFNRATEALARVGGNSPLTSPAEQQKFSAIKERLITESKKGNAVAKSVVSAASPVVTGAALPETNQVQQVNLEDYEEVKETWEDNYRKLEPPTNSDGRPKSRSEWLKQEIKDIPVVIDLLLSGDPAHIEQGKQMVSKILPFLLLGGFSNTEIVSYLKAKLEAAKSVLKEVLQVEGKEEEEDSKIEVDRTQHAEKSMAAHAEAPLPEEQKTASASDSGDSSFDEVEKSPISGALAGSPSGLSGAGSTINNANQVNNNQVSNELLKLTNLTIPTIKKIAEIETTILSGEGPAKNDINTLNELVQGLSVETPADPAKRNTLIQVKEKLGTAANRGDAVAKSIQAAMMPVSQVKIPESNEVQQVNLDDYEEAKKTWAENYKKVEVPPKTDGSSRSREEWLKEEVNQIPRVIELLLSSNPSETEEGKKMVAKVLPFLLIGGFSKAEITTYLKAKLEAAKMVLGELSGQKEEVQVDRNNSVSGKNSAEAALPNVVPQGSAPDKING